MAKRKRTQNRTYREPIPSEWDQDEPGWSGLKVGLACAGVVALTVLGWLAWLNLYTTGAAGAMIFVIVYIALKMADRYFKDQE